MLSHDESGIYILRNKDRDRFFQHFISILLILIFIRARVSSLSINPLN